MSSCVATPGSARLHRQSMAEHTGPAPAGLCTLPQEVARQPGENKQGQAAQERRKIGTGRKYTAADVNIRFLKVRSVGSS